MIRYNSTTGFMEAYESNAWATLAAVQTGIYTATATLETSGTITLDSSNNTLSYEKIGTFVHVHGRINVASVSSPVGPIDITLPFAAAAAVHTFDARSQVLVSVGATASSLAGVASAKIYENASVLNVYSTSATSDVGSSIGAQIQTGSYFTISATYRSAN